MRSARRRGNGGNLGKGGNGEIVEPAPERYRADHVGGGMVDRCEEPISDAIGGIGRPWRTLDSLARMERAGRITAAMRAAGLIFNEHFNEAGLDPLWAADPTRIPVLSHRSYLINARRGSLLAVEMVIEALERLGGIASVGGSCAWHVLGCECTIESWAISRCWATIRIDRHAARGILLTDLGILQNHYAVPEAC